MGVPPNHPYSSILIGFSTIIHYNPFWGTLIYGTSHIFKAPFPSTAFFPPWHIARHGFGEGSHLYDVVEKFPTFHQLHDLWLP